tara:strand:- start:612 stop:1637 length:1026 start_codon:yes stop_codon:yes gene_type:complete
MGIKRLNRSRLHNIEKEGKDVTDLIGIKPGMKNALEKATQSRQGHQVITDIVLDLGTSKGTILTGGTTANNPIGESGALATICTCAPAVFGMITNVETVQLEALAYGATGTAYANNLNIALVAAANCVQGAATGSPAAISDLSGIGAGVGTHKIDPYDDDSLKGTKSLCIVAPAAAGTKVAGTATLSGIPAHGDVGTIANGSRLVLYNEAGAKFEMVIDKTVAYNATAQKNKIHLGSVGSQDNMDQGFKAGIEATNSDFSVTKNGGSVTIAAKSGSGAEGNNESHGNDNSYVKASGETATLAITNFTGGTTQGLTSANATAAFTGGKFLIRITGFMTPDDI